MYWPRGRVWGGSSSLNAMAYVRGHAEDYNRSGAVDISRPRRKNLGLDINIYNRWEREGAEGWSYEDVLPYFKKAQVSCSIVSM